MPVRVEVKIGFSDGAEAWYEVRSPLADLAPVGLIPLGAGADTVSWPTVAEDPVVAFAAARLREEEAAAQHSGPARIAWLTYRDDKGQMLYTTVAAANDGAPWVADGHELPRPASARVVYDPARALRGIKAKRAIIGSQTSDHAPVETMYGLSCRTCVTWQDAPVIEGGETEFGIAIPQSWPCRVARSVVASWSEHPDYRKDEWAQGD